jgi:[ribosomal protein S5]-alanine N-acetyltransferase
MKRFSNELVSTSQLKLKSLTVSDYSEKYLSWLNDKLVNQYLETRWEKQSEEKIKSFIKGIELDQDSVLYGIIFNNEHIGNIKLGPINWNHKHTDISYFIGSSKYWGKGLASESVAIVTKFAFEQLGLNKCNAGVYSGNVGSAKVLEKVGFKLEGCLKNELYGPNGWEDHLLYGYLKRNFKKNE